MAPTHPKPKAFFFDVFGTCVDWRKTTTDELWAAHLEALASPSLSATVRAKANDMTKETWGEIAQEWRNSYLKFTRSLATDPTIPWKSVDAHHLDALHSILESRGLITCSEEGTATPGSLLTEPKLADLTQAWHRLAPWPGTVAGLEALNKIAPICTLSNGNKTLLHDMVSTGNMPFTHILSAEDFQSYKPSPKVYLGAVERMGLEPGECAMVAAHLDDLKYAKANGLQTVYVWRAQEERFPELGAEGFVDLWVGEGEDGFMTVAERLEAMYG